MQQQTLKKKTNFLRLRSRKKGQELTLQDSQLATISNFIWNIADSVAGQAESRVFFISVSNDYPAGRKR